MSCKPMSTEEFIERARIVHGDKYDYSKVNYTLRSNKIIITCPTHGDFEQVPNNHLNKNGCRLCWRAERSYDAEEFRKKAASVHGNKYDYSKVVYKNAMIKICVVCTQHGDFYCTPNNHLSSKSGCPRCKKSKGELAVISILSKHNIKYLDEYKLPHYNFEYDFYLPELNVFIEFHGKQHYEPIDYFGGMETFKYTRKCDTMKKALAREYKIPLIELNYKQLEQCKEDEFEKLLLQRLSKMVK